MKLHVLHIIVSNKVFSYLYCSFIVTMRILFKQVSLEYFDFLEGNQIHEVIGVTQEGFQLVKKNNIKDMTPKVDLSKAFDRVSWLFLHLIFIHLGFNIRFMT